MNRWVIALAAVPAIGLAGSLPASVGPAGVPLEVNEDGFCIVAVRLASSRAGEGDRTFRFLLDTGASATLVDAAMPARFVRDEGRSVPVWDITGVRVEGARARLHGLAFPGFVRTNVPVVRVDLRGSFGPLEDAPIDGVLGMDLLEQFPFVLDLPRRRWWPGRRLPGRTRSVPLRRVPGAPPQVELRAGGGTLLADVDTGSMGGVQVPPDRCPAPGRAWVEGAGLSRTRTRSRVGWLEEVRAGALRWREVPVDCCAPDGRGLLGLDLWSGCAVGFDFAVPCLEVPADRALDMPLRRPASRTLPVAWDRGVSPAVLRVIAVRPGSGMDRAGCRVGDVLVRVGPLAGNRLTRRGILGWVRRGAPHAWIIRREGVLARLAYPGEGGERKGHGP